MKIQYITSFVKVALIMFTFNLFPIYAAELSVEDNIKGRKAIFSKNYKTAKKVQALSSKEDFGKAKELMIEMSKNYKVLLKYFPENTKEGFKTEALPSIWENKNEFNNLMTKASEDMIQLAMVIEETENIKDTLKKFMWSNCKACHSKFRIEDH